MVGRGLWLLDKFPLEYQVHSPKLPSSCFASLRAWHPSLLCLYLCKHLEADHSDYLALLRKLREIPGVKKVFVRSGIRFDYVLCDKNSPFLSELVRYHISGQLKVAPEHCVDSVLGYMGKPPSAVYERFLEKYAALNRRYGKDQFLVPYLMSSHPGSTLADAVALALYLKKHNRARSRYRIFTPRRARSAPACTIRESTRSP